MFVDTHMVPIKKEDSNKGSCGKLIEYLAKENDMFFNHELSNISPEDAKEIVDKHSKGRLGKDESKWYSPMYSLSVEECKHIVNILFDKDYENYSELSDLEKKQYNEYIIFLGRRFQDQMAYNFGKSDLGISSGSDLVYVGVVENDRYYKSSDEEVKLGRRKVGEEKEGFNTHIHIIQSRKANNEKQSKISPEAKFKSRTKENFGTNTKSGFDRNNFYNLVETSFDKETKFIRNQTQSFEHRKIKKKVSKINKNTMSSKFLTEDDRKAIENNSSLVDYFFSLADRGILKYDKKTGDNYVFAKRKEHTNDFQSTGSILVKEGVGWRDFENDEKGKINNAVMKYEKLTWLESYHYLKDKNGFVGYEFKNDSQVKDAKQQRSAQSSAEVVRVEKVSNKYILDYYKSRGISEETIYNNVKQIVYKRNEKTFISGGIENIKGGFNVRGHNFKSIIGDHNDISIINGSKDRLLIFEGLVDYMSWLELNNKSKTEETIVIINSTSNFSSTINFINNNSFTDIGLLVNKDAAGDKFCIKLEKEFGKIFTDLRDEYDLSPELDLNDKLIIEQVKDVSKKGYKF